MKDKRLEMRVRTDELEAWTMVADADGQSVSAWLRSIANEAVDQYQVKVTGLHPDEDGFHNMPNATPEQEAIAREAAKELGLPLPDGEIVPVNEAVQRCVQARDGVKAGTPRPGEMCFQCARRQRVGLPIPAKCGECGR